MPIYEYKAVEAGCERCQAGFQILQRLKDDPLISCPSCGVPVEKILSTFGVSSSVLSPSNLKSHGFTTLKKKDKGVYERIS